MASTSSNALTTGDAGGQPPATGPSRPNSPLSFFDPNGRPVSIIDFFAGDMGSHGGHMSASSKDSVAADRAMAALASEISSAFVQGSGSFGSEAIGAALEGLDWYDFRRLASSPNA